MRIVKLNAEGWWKNRTVLPNYSGIYFVYAAKQNDKKEICSMRLLYIGETDNIHKRHNGTEEKPEKHEHYDDFINELEQDEVLKYITAKYEGSEDNRKEIQNALIFKNNPPVNEKSTKTYTGQDLQVFFSTSDSITVPKSISIKKGECRP